MSIVMGPVLGFRGLTSGMWRVSALIVTDGDAAAPALTWRIGNDAQQAQAPARLKTVGTRTAWRYDWSVAQTGEAREVAYDLGNGPHSFYVPADKAPLRFAYASCNGFSNPKYMKRVADKNAMWKRMKLEHESVDSKTGQPTPFHILLMGGDQLYSDSMWETIPVLRKWNEKWHSGKVKAEFTAAMQRDVEKFYFNLYCERWTQTEVAEMLARIPTLMMWDDHDIFDGWGSYPDDLRECAVFQGIFREARAHFAVFQLQADPADLASVTGLLPNQDGFSFAHRIGELALVAPDLRSERTDKRVMTERSWDAVFEWIGAQADCAHLLLMSSIPVIYVNANMLERALGALPGQWDLEDDLRDQWESEPHQIERLRLIHRLLEFSQQGRARVTLLSGDVHVGAVGYIESDRQGLPGDNSNIINQLISSAIVHSPLDRLALYLIERVMGDKVEEIDRGITAQLLTFPGTGFHFIGARNFLSLTLDDKDRIWAEWHVEDTDDPNARKVYSKVVHPVSDQQ